jgi:hypothetical protein
MPAIRRQQILETLEATLPPEEAERAFQGVLLEAGLKDKALYWPDDLARLGRVLMERAARSLA